MTQMQTEQLTHEEYCHHLAYGDPMSNDAYSPNEHDLDWISTLDSTTYPGLTFGYSVAPYMYTAL